MHRDTRTGFNTGITIIVNQEKWRKTWCCPRLVLRLEWGIRQPVHFRFHRHDSGRAHVVSVSERCEIAVHPTESVIKINLPIVGWFFVKLSRRIHGRFRPLSWHSRWIVTARHLGRFSWEPCIADCGRSQWQSWTNFRWDDASNENPKTSKIKAVYEQDLMEYIVCKLSVQLYFSPLRLSWRYDFTRKLSFEADGSRWFESLRPQGWCEAEQDPALRRRKTDYRMYKAQLFIFV